MRRRQVTEDHDDVSKLPDAPAVGHSDIIDHISEKNKKKHDDAIQQLDQELRAIDEDHTTHVVSVSRQLVSSLRDVDERLSTLRDSLDKLHDASLQGVCDVWDQLLEELSVKKKNISEFRQSLLDRECLHGRQIRAVLASSCHMLENLSFLPPLSVRRLILDKAMGLNASLLMERRRSAQLVLLLQEDVLRQESLIRLQWEDTLSGWKTRRVQQVIDGFRTCCRGDDDECLWAEQQVFEKMRQRLSHLTERRRDIITDIRGLVPPSVELVSDWLNKMTAVNQQIDRFHTLLLEQVRNCTERVQEHRLANIVRCKEALAALQLSDEQVSEVLNSELLPLIGQSHRHDEERQTATEVWLNSVSRSSYRLSNCVFVVMRAVALLWEMYCSSVQRREQELDRHLDFLTHSQKPQRMNIAAELNLLLARLRQESNMDALLAVLHPEAGKETTEAERRQEGKKDSLLTERRQESKKETKLLERRQESKKKTLQEQMKDIQQKWGSQQVMEQSNSVLDRLPWIFVDELSSYSRNLATFFRLSDAFSPSPEELQKLRPRSIANINKKANNKNTQELSDDRAPRRQDDDDPMTHDWLIEAETCLRDISDFNVWESFTSTRGVSYTGPAFRCSAPDMPDSVPRETDLTVFDVNLLTHTLSSTRTLLLEHLEERFHVVLTSAGSMVKERKEAVRLDQTLLSKGLNPEVLCLHVTERRLAELQTHQQCWDSHRHQVTEELNSCFSDFEQHQLSVTSRNQLISDMLTCMEGDVQTAKTSRRRLSELSSALQDGLDSHIRDLQNLQSSFSESVQSRVQYLREATKSLLGSFRVFSEGGHFSVPEVKHYQKQLVEENRRIKENEEAVHAKLEDFSRTSQLKVKVASARLEEKLSIMLSEAEFQEKVQDIITRSRLQMKAEEATSVQQQLRIRGKLEQLRRMMDDPQESPDEVCSFLSSIIDDLNRRRHYLDHPLDPSEGQAPEQEVYLQLAPLSSKKQVQAETPFGFLQPSMAKTCMLNDQVVGVVKSLGKVKGGTDPPGDPGMRSENKVHEVQSSESGRHRSHRSGGADKRIQVFGSRPAPDQTPESFLAIVTSLLWRANDVLMQEAEEFYQTERRGELRLLPNRQDHWAENMQQRLLGYLSGAHTLLSMCREEFVRQECDLGEIMSSLPAVLIRNHERQQGALLRQEVSRAKLELEETMSASETVKMSKVKELRAWLRGEKLQELIRVENKRQEELQSAICCCHKKLQEYVKVRREQFVSSLMVLTEGLLRHMDQLLMPNGAAHGTAVRAWSTVPVAISTSIAMCKVAMGKERDAAVKSFEELCRTLLSDSDSDKRRRLNELESWRKHWRHQIHTHTLV
ncbi:coiled-coil domain-containing protein 180 [Synchiropus picturatus]